MNSQNKKWMSSGDRSRKNGCGREREFSTVTFLAGKNHALLSLQIS